jgi:hypothetical protein
MRRLPPVLAPLPALRVDERVEREAATGLVKGGELRRLRRLGVPWPTLRARRSPIREWIGLRR